MLRKSLIGFGLLAMTFACNTSLPDSQLAAKVNGQGITKAAFKAEVARNMARYEGQGHQLPPGIKVRIKESVLRRMIDDEIIRQKAKALGISISSKDLDAKFNEHKARFHSDQNFEEYLKRSHNTEANMKADLKRNMLRDKVVEKLAGPITVTDDEVAKYYNDNKFRFDQKEQVKVARILVRLAPNATAKEKRAAERKAKKVRAAAAKKGADFATIARQSSNGPAASRGGELGWMTRGRMPPDFDKAAFSLQPGQVSKVVQTRMGYEIIKVEDKKPEKQRTLDEVKDNIKNMLLARARNEKRRTVLQKLKSGAKVEQLIKFQEPQPMAPRAMIPPHVPGRPPMLPANHPGLPVPHAMPAGHPPVGPARAAMPAPKPSAPAAHK